jgi:hypothetical protein
MGHKKSSSASVSGQKIERENHQGAEIVEGLSPLSEAPTLGVPVAMVLTAMKMVARGDSKVSVQHCCALSKPNWMRSKIDMMIWYVLDQDRGEGRVRSYGNRRSVSRNTFYGFKPTAIVHSIPQASFVTTQSSERPDRYNYWPNNCL